MNKSAGIVVLFRAFVIDDCMDAGGRATQEQFAEERAKTG